MSEYIPDDVYDADAFEERALVRALTEPDDTPVPEVDSRSAVDSSSSAGAR